MWEESSRKIYAGGGILIINYMKEREREKCLDGGWSCH
jgi:hypothetical protein